MKYDLFAEVDRYDTWKFHGALSFPLLALLYVYYRTAGWAVHVRRLP
jgi:hypothetical protein